MNFPFGWFLPAVAIVATGVAVWAGDNFSLAIPAAVAALLAAGLLFVDAVLGPGWVARRPEGPFLAGEAGPLRTAFRSGRLGREAIADLLDRLERAGPNPDLPGRRTEETNRLVRLPSGEFRNYVRQRLDDLESRS
jgi:hypothetical protein